MDENPVLWPKGMDEFSFSCDQFFDLFLSFLPSVDHMRQIGKF